MYTVLSVIFAYLIGSISSAVIVSKVLGRPDPRDSGSGNPGATNVLRLSGKLAGVLTLMGDIAKGIIPVLVASIWIDEPIAVAAASLAAFLGHLYPIYFGFAGGKGIATAIGVYLGVGLPIGLSVAGVWLAVAVITRYSSLSSLLAMLSAAFLIWRFEDNLWIPGAAIVIFIFSVYRHRANIQRLIAGNENKINFSTQ